jgi:phosphohistidine swiveling domain-containing protein
VGSGIGWVIPLENGADCDERYIGGKAAKLAQLAHAGYRVPNGFCVTTLAYERFLEVGNLANTIRMELGRKPLESMRWEEIWDAALRIRLAFLAVPIPLDVSQTIEAALEKLGRVRAWAVRSSAPGEDSANRSFAGLHESRVGVVGNEAVLDAIRVVWASLWSDAALLYRRELSLDPTCSRMAVVIQEMIDEQPSGVAFGRDPRGTQRNQVIVEAVPGLCGDLVDGMVDPDRWILERSSGEILEWRAGDRPNDQTRDPILEKNDLNTLLQTLRNVETLLGWPPDVEWTGRAERFTLLQARPITTVDQESGDTRSWYLSLRPGERRLSSLAEQVAQELIPQLEGEGERFAAEALDSYDDKGLAAAIEERYTALQKWRQIYLDEFIPFAHGVRHLGIYYNDAVRPEDPYEFVGLLKGQRMVASQRNQALVTLAHQLREDDALKDTVRQAVHISNPDPAKGWQEVRAKIRALPRGEEFLREFEDLLRGHMDVAYGSDRLADRPESILKTVLEMAQAANRARQRPLDGVPADTDAKALEQRLFDAVGEDRREEATEALTIGRLSWRLRDDDNVLIGRLESQVLRALDLGADRLRAAGRLHAGAKVGIAAGPAVAEALKDVRGVPVILPAELETKHPSPTITAGETPRQLIGQPAAPGLATGRVRSVRSTEDLEHFHAGEVLVCDAIQPTMTHLVPLASAIVERRGGMLIHGAIIARELGIPCVNGIPNAVDLLHDGELVTVDGHLGIVTVGPPEFDLEGVT